MMVVFNVIVLIDLGYNEIVFCDFMEVRWRVELVMVVKFIMVVIIEKIQFMVGLQFYNNVEEVLEVFDEYWVMYSKCDV